METKKAKIFNVIILDKSGSMQSIARQAMDGVNETLGSIRSSQLRNPEQDNYVTLVAFCGCERRTIYDATPIADARDITASDYRPCCTTPLYDAVGFTITRMHNEVEGHRAAVSVTIITDGYENSSREYTGEAVKSLIDSYKKQGWLFAYIGADHDVEAVAARLSIQHTLTFDKTAEGTAKMFSTGNVARSKWSKKMSELLVDDSLSDEALPMGMLDANEDYFDK